MWVWILFFLHNKKHHSKTACCAYLCYLWLIFKFVWWSETWKCGKHAKKKKSGRGPTLFHTTVYKHGFGCVLHLNSFCSRFTYVLKDFEISSSSNIISFFISCDAELDDGAKTGSLISYLITSAGWLASFWMLQSINALHKTPWI